MRFSKRRKNIGVLSILLLISIAASASNRNVDVDADFVSAVALRAGGDLDFGVVEVDGVFGSARVGTDGSVVYGGDASGSGRGAAGRVEILAGEDGMVVDVSCEPAARLTDGMSSFVEIDQVEVALEGSEGAPGAGAICAGIGSSILSFALDRSYLGADELYIGARVTIPEAGGGFSVSPVCPPMCGGGGTFGPALGTFSTSFDGGNPLIVEVVYR